MPELLGLVSLPESALLLILFVSSHLKLVTPDLIKSRTGVRAHQVIISLDLLNEEARDPEGKGNRASCSHPGLHI